MPKSALLPGGYRWVIKLHVDAGWKQRITVTAHTPAGTFQIVRKETGNDTHDTIWDNIDNPFGSGVEWRAEVLCEHFWPGEEWRENTYQPGPDPVRPSQVPTALGPLWYCEVRSDDTPPAHEHTWINAWASFQQKYP